MDWEFLARKRGWRKPGGYPNAWSAQVSDGSPSRGRGASYPQLQPLKLWVSAVFTM